MISLKHVLIFRKAIEQGKETWWGNIKTKVKLLFIYLFYLK